MKQCIAVRHKIQGYQSLKLLYLKLKLTVNIIP